jgi:photosystem II stability/assembly factor-like uncharacterized protein
MTEPDDDLGRRLREVLRDGALNVPAAPDALDRVHAGARRRQHRRNAASSAAAVVVVAIAATGAVALRPHAHATVSAGKERTTSPSESVALSTVGVVSPRPTTAPQSGSASASQPSVSTVAVTFDPISVTAISTNSYWVLGSTACAAVRCAVLAHTTDGGATFTRVGRTTDGSPMPAIDTNVESGATVRDVRFGDTKNGWLYGGALYSTHDGGTTWAPDTSLPNDVVDIAAASGEVWAIALGVVGSAESYGLYHATYGASGTGQWTAVKLPIELGSTQPSIVDQDGTVTVMASGLQRSGNHGHVLVATPGGAFADYAGPCSQDLGGYLSNSVAGIWAVCPTGHMAGVAVSIDRGLTWNNVSNLPPPSFPDPGRGGIGAVDDAHAFVYDLATSSLVGVTVGGSPVRVTVGPTAVAGTAFIGFTTINVGFAVVYDQNSGSELWRTTDGGQTWAVVAF